MSQKTQEKIIVIDFGGQYNELVARRVRQCQVYCEIYSYKTKIDILKAMKPKGFILTGGPDSCYLKDAAKCSPQLFDLGIPVLGICYGAQLMMHILGGKVEKAHVQEYGKTILNVNESSLLFKYVNKTSVCWMSHADMIAKPAQGFEIIASTRNCSCAALENTQKKLYALQFHPEVAHTEMGSIMIHNFVRDICGCKGIWKMDSFVDDEIASIREKVGDGKVLLALSGGVDSLVTAGILSRAIGKNLSCVFVDHGLLRKNEASDVAYLFGQSGILDLNFIHVDAASFFFDKLIGVTNPESKRKIIGEAFVRVFEMKAREMGHVDFLAQGTIYPDVVESGSGGESASIKSHHNVGGLPDHLSFKEIIEPLRYLFKDEVREVGLKLGLPENLVYRQPFPGPGLGIRIIGEVTREKVQIVRDADFIFRKEVDKAVDAYKRANGDVPFWKPDQYFAALTNMRSVGVMGDERSYDYAVVLRAVKTDDFMTCEAARIPFDILEKATTRITNEITGVNRTFYDLSSKPPGTIEFE